ncbi:MAG: mycothiol system anti-sigma-R factor [Thermoanaerobaculia bacterium]
MASRIECEEAIAKLLEFLDGELDETDRSRMHQHLETCRACYTRAEFERRLRERVAETGSAPAPDSLRTRVRRLMETF